MSLVMGECPFRQVWVSSSESKNPQYEKEHVSKDADDTAELTIILDKMWN